VFEKGNRKENIQFIDASSKLLSFLNPDKSISLKVDKIESLINWNNANDSNVINESLVGYGNDDFDLKIPVKDIQVREYDLTTGKYIAEQETYGDDYVSLDSIVSKRIASLVNIEKLLPFIRVSDLNGKILKDFSKIGLNTTSRKGKHINKPSILIGTVGESFKPTLYEGKFDIEVSSNIAIFEFDLLHLIQLHQRYYHF